MAIVFNRGEKKQSLGITKYRFFLSWNAYCNCGIHGLVLWDNILRSSSKNDTYKKKGSIQLHHGENEIEYIKIP